MSSQQAARDRIRSLFESGITNQEQLAKRARTCKKTVSRTLTTLKTTGAVNRKKGTGPKPKLTGRDRQRLAQVALRNDRWSNTKIGKRLHTLGSPSVDPRTIGRNLKKMEIDRKTPRKARECREGDIVLAPVNERGEVERGKTGASFDSGMRKMMNSN